MSQHERILAETEALLSDYRTNNDTQALVSASAILAEALESSHAQVEFTQLHNQMSRVLRDVAEHMGSLEYLNMAIKHAATAVQASAGDDPDRLAYLNNLAQALGDRYEFTADQDDLDNALFCYRQAYALTPRHSPAQAIVASGLVSILRMRYVKDGELSDLEEAVHLGRQVAEDTAHHEHSILDELANCLMHWVQATGDTDRLAEADDIALTAVRLAEGTSRYAGCLASFASVRLELARHTRQADLLDNALTAVDHALSLTSATTLTAGWLTTSGNVLEEKFLRTGDPVFLHQAADRLTRAVDATQHDDVHRAERLSALSTVLRNLFHSEGTASAVRAAVDHAREAVNLAPAGSAFRWGFLMNLGSALLDRADTEAGAAENRTVTKAVAVLREADATAPANSGQRGTLVNNLAVGLLRSFRPGLGDDALDEAEQRCRAWLSREPDHLLVRATLGRVLAERVVSCAQPEYAEEAEQVLRSLLTGAGAGDAVHMAAMANLSRLAREQVRLGHTAANRDRAIGLARAVANHPHAPDAKRLAARLAVAELLDGDWALKAAEYAAVIDSLATVAPRSWEQIDREYGASRFATAVSDAAAAAIAAGDLEGAITVLERGRGLLTESGGALADLAALEQARPDLAERYQEIQAALAALNDPTDALASTAQAATANLLRRQQLHREEQHLLAEIRRTHRFGSFLRPPDCHALLPALPGLVVLINTSVHRCDAIIVDCGRITLVPLVKANHLDMAWHTSRFLHAVQSFDRDGEQDDAVKIAIDTLTWLWHQVMLPILEELGPRDRVWWCPIGALCFLPLHAAGPYRSGGWEAVLDHVVSSYTPSLRALAAAASKADTPAPPSMLAVGVPEAPGLPPLKGAETEARAAAAAFRDSTVLIGPTATRVGVLNGLTKHTWFHFAGHGKQSTVNATNARLVTHDVISGGVRAADISTLPAATAHTAYLSSCQTAAGKITLPNEGAHIAGAFLGAGFTHVVASSWKVRDDVAVDVAEAFYRRAHDQSPAHALHAAVRELRARMAEDPEAGGLDLFIWTPFVHFGA